MNAYELVQKDLMSTKEIGNKEELEHEETNAHEDKVLYHHVYRKELLTQAAKAVGTTYDHEPECGSAPLDMTAVHEDQLSWGKDIKHHPAELLSFYPPTVVSVSEKAIGNLKYDGKLLLDYRGKALRDFPSLPLVISSMVEGWRVEAWMRSDSRMKMTDILTRIPVEQANNPAGHQIPMPIYNSGTVRERVTGQVGCVL